MPKGRYLSDIEVLPESEAIRRRPELYVGDPATSAALTQLALEPLCLAVDAHLNAGPAVRQVTLSLLEGDRADVSNDGPGLPLGSPDGKDATYIEILMTKLFACRDRSDLPVYGTDDIHQRWCGIGIAALSALSAWCEVTVRREGGVWVQRFERGAAQGPIERRGDTDLTGTSLLFQPDRGILGGRWDARQLQEGLDAFVRDVPCVRVEFRDLRGTPEAL